MFDISVIEDPAAAEVSLDPVRARLLAELRDPGSATMLAARVGLARQKVNYHLRTLEQHGLIVLVEERRKGNVTERIVQAAAASFVISPVALAAVAPDPDRHPDRLSASWLLALGARLVKDVGGLLVGATKAGKRLSTFGLTGEVRFANAADRSAFASELADTVTALISKYNVPAAPGTRGYRLVVGLHPSPTSLADAATTDTRPPGAPGPGAPEPTPPAPTTPHDQSGAPS